LNTIDALLASLSGDAPLRDVAVGVRWTAVVTDTTPPRGGIASSLGTGPGEGTASPLPSADELLALSARELAGWLLTQQPPRSSVGMAALNALLEVDLSRCREVNAEQLLLERAPGRRVAVVGHFPFTDRLRAAAAACDVLELRPRPGDLPADAAPEVLPRADVVALTGTSLLNGTFDELIALCRPDAYVVLLGASAPLSPVLFDRGVDVICGTVVTDPLAAAAAARLGAGFRRIPGRRLVAMARSDADS